MTLFASPGVEQAQALAKRFFYAKRAMQEAASGSVVVVFNAVWDPGGPEWVVWGSDSAPDTAGSIYPDPYGTGFAGCSGYREVGRAL